MKAHFSISFSTALDSASAAKELMIAAEAELGGGGVAGGLILSTAAGGSAGGDVGRLLGERWPEAALAGTSFEGLLVDGRILRDVPAMTLLAWGGSPDDVTQPIPILLSDPGIALDAVADEILAAAEVDTLSQADLLLIFPDAHGRALDDGDLAALQTRLGGPEVAGAAASGADGGSGLSWFGDADEERGAWVGLVLRAPNGCPREEDSTRPGHGARGDVAVLASRVSVARASSLASDWQGVTECRSRWVDRLGSERAIEALRAALGVGRRDALEPYLGRVLVRIREGAVGGESEGRIGDGGDGPESESGSDAADVERYIIGIDPDRGAFSVPFELHRGQEIAFALPDAAQARQALEAGLKKIRPSQSILQFACRARDIDLHGDPDLEAAWVVAHAPDRRILGTVAPFQIGPDALGRPRILVHSTVLAAPDCD